VTSHRVNYCRCMCSSRLQPQTRSLMSSICACLPTLTPVLGFSRVASMIRPTELRIMSPSKTKNRFCRLRLVPSPTSSGGGQRQAKGTTPKSLRISVCRAMRARKWSPIAELSSGAMEHAHSSLAPSSSRFSKSPSTTLNCSLSTAITAVLRAKFKTNGL
jgi:hypothetical protein